MYVYQLRSMYVWLTEHYIQAHTADYLCTMGACTIIAQYTTTHAARLQIMIVLMIEIESLAAKIALH